MGAEEEDEHNEVPEKKQFEDTICKKILRFFFSFFGLFFLLGGYIVGVSFFFHTSEGDLELVRKERMLEKADYLNDSIHYVADHLQFISYDEQHRYVYECMLYVDDPYYTNETLHNICLDRYDEGMRNSRFCTCMWDTQERFEAEVKGKLTKLIELIVNVMGEFGYQEDPVTRNVLWKEDWSFFNSLLFFMTSLTLVGYGHIAPTTDNNKGFLVVFTIIGLPLMMVFLANIGTHMANGLTLLYSRICCRWCRVRRKRSGKAGVKRALEAMGESEKVPDSASDKLIREKVTLKKEKVGEEDYMSSKNILVPIVLTLTVMTCYIMVGSIIFSNWEGWTLMDSCYFCFITLTTLGFGDFVPGASFIGTDDDQTDRYIKMTFTTLYSLTGLALIAMGINLVSEQLKLKFSSNRGKKNMDRYILKKHLGVRETPPDKTGLHTHFGGSKKGSAKSKGKAEPFSDLSKVPEEEDEGLFEDQVELEV